MSAPILETILSHAAKIQASDIHLKPGTSPVFRRDGILVSMKGGKALTVEEVKAIALGIMNSHHQVCFDEEHQVEFALQNGEGRFRVSVFSENGSLALAIRTIPGKIPTVEELGLPLVVEKLALNERGLVLVSGATGSGKTTTLAAMIDQINRHRSCHIVTIEDPVEYRHTGVRSIVSQREIGLDCLSFSQALSGILRQDPDVIMVGEMRNRETIEIAMSAAETGHLVLGTLHSAGTVDTITRIVSAFPDEQKSEVRHLLSHVLCGIVCQRLVPRADGKGMVLAAEVLVNTARVAAAIRDQEKTAQITEALQRGFESYGMQSFDQALLRIYEQELITYDEAVRQATNPDDFALKVRGVSSGSFSSLS